MLVLISIAFVFGSQNEQMISLNYLIARVELSIAAAVSLFTLIGISIGILVTILWRLIRKGKKALAKNRSTEA